ncbi:DUF2335 domain-containing protein [Methylotuvimicrobium sp. KM2]|uniref:DUF2335 domain-containing protein n=1 Tax=Methylotuvimicrobium sp. KM2 TaxID=3133976 RepID=UPI00310122DE
MSRSTKQNKQQNDSNQIVSAQWQGPLPPPSTLREFDDIIQNGAERIMRMAEIEQQHRHDSEKKLIENDVRSIRRGQYLGWLVAALSITGAVVTAYWGAHWAVSCALVGVPILGTVKAIIGK